jgi:putative Mg2+ transporter-C (MgtC) family protein
MKKEVVVILNPEWLEVLQFLIRLVLSLLCGLMISLAFSREPNHSAGYFIILVTLGAALLKMVSSRIFDTQFLFAELALFMALILAISILAGAQIISKPGQANGLKTAGGIWIGGAIGLAIGSGYYIAGIFTAIVGHFLLNYMKVKTNSSINQNH